MVVVEVDIGRLLVSSSHLNTIRHCWLSAVEADGTEKSIGSADFSGNQLEVSIQPNSIRTYKVRFNDNKKEELRCEQLPLNYDRKCFSWNEFRWEANFEDACCE